MDDFTRFLIESKAVLVGLWFAAFFVAERLWPAARGTVVEGGREQSWPHGWQRNARNLLLFGLNMGVSLLIVVPVSAFAAGIDLGWRPEWWGLALDLLILDFWIYWWHRANHEVPLLWRFHQVHHLDRFLDTTSAVRFHFGEVIASALVRALVIVALQIPLSSVLFFETLILAAAIFQHSNLRLSPKVEFALSRLFITPGIHWVHHHRVRADTDSNYGTIFSFWDRLFRSRSGTVRTRDMEIGVQGREEEGMTGLLLAPFRR